MKSLTIIPCKEKRISHFILTNKKQNLVEVARSFSRKLNLGNYQTADFFCSQKAEVLESEVVETSEALYKFCKEEVEKSVWDYLAENQEKIPEEPPVKWLGEKGNKQPVAKSDAEESTRQEKWHEQE
jgi:ATP-dependent exoDNAse (exonuclease V) alpha subunit